jgi:pantothenate kinase
VADPNPPADGAPDPVTLGELAADLRALAAASTGPGGRAIVGLCGPPGTGKSTTAFRLRDALGVERAVVVQLDGFHLATPVIADTPLAARRGAIDTFDPGGFASLVERVRANDEPVVYAPSFERDLEEPINASVAVRPEHDVVIVEGNYLLADGAEWARVRSCLDEVWYLHTAPGLRLPRLVQRHVASGKSPAAATAWVADSDEVNARLIASTADRADRFLDVSALPPPDATADTHRGRIDCHTHAVEWLRRSNRTRGKGWS